MHLKSIWKRVMALLLCAVLLLTLAVVSPARADDDPPDDDDDAPPASVVKTAKVLKEGGSEESGDPDAPVPVSVGDFIEYTLTVNVEEPPPPSAKYDVVFLLDWSASLDIYSDSSAKSSRVLAKDTVLQISEKIIDTYAGSRVAVMGLNSGIQGKNKDNIAYMYLQYDTPFVSTEAEYHSIIEAAFQADPYLRNDDVPSFIRAGIDKFDGTATSYGGGTDDTTSRYIPIKRPISRDQSDAADRIPVLIIISDFQYTPTEANSLVPRMTAQFNRFKTAYPEGIVLALRCDHIMNADYTGTTYNSRLDAWMSLGGTNAQGEARWRWINFTKSTDHGNDNALFWSIFQSQVPNLDASVQLIDELPSGLEFNSATPTPQSTQDGKIIWDMTTLPVGESTYTIKVQVTEENVFENQAELIVNSEERFESNPTYHSSVVDMATIYVRQVVINRDNNAVSAPQKGYVTLATDDGAHNLVCESGTNSSVAFTQYDVVRTQQDDAALTGIIPQYFEYAGHVATTQEFPAHDPAARDPRHVLLDFDSSAVYWVTIYIQPMATTPGNNKSTEATNEFGTIYSRAV